MQGGSWGTWVAGESSPETEEMVSVVATEVTAKMRLLECRGSTPLLVQAAVWRPGSLQQHLLACFCS